MRNLPSSIGVVESEELRRQRNRGELKSVRTGRRWLLMPEGLMPKGRRELEVGLQPMVERPSFRFALLLPDVIGAHCDFIVDCFRMSVGHKVFGGVGTSARYCDIVILRESVEGQVDRALTELADDFERSLINPKEFLDELAGEDAEEGEEAKAARVRKETQAKAKRTEKRNAKAREK